MSKHSIQDIAEKADGLMEPRGIQNEAVEDDSSLRFRIYQIYRERRGSSMDNWLEAERMLRNSDRAVLSFINEGNPNSQM